MLIATHYYSDHCVPLLNILSATEDERECLIAKLSQNPNKAFNRFRNSQWYLNERRKLENWMYREFVGIGGIPRIQHPLYFVLGYSSYLKSCIGKDARHISIDVDALNSREISFTLYDSLAMFVTDECEKKLYTKDMILEYLRMEDTNPEKLDKQKRYIEVQIWNDDFLRSSQCRMEQEGWRPDGMV